MLHIYRSYGHELVCTSAELLLEGGRRLRASCLDFSHEGIWMRLDSLPLLGAVSSL